jgi:hypothetical protein
MTNALSFACGDKGIKLTKAMATNKRSVCGKALSRSEHTYASWGLIVHEKHAHMMSSSRGCSYTPV